jgi:HNH endonuclease/NUMOD4 motif
VGDTTPARWLPVPYPRYEGLYEASSEGAIRSFIRVTRWGRRGGCVLKPWVQSAGYLAVSLYDAAGTRKRFYIHHLVAAAFIGPRPKGMDIRHLDGNPANNVARNLAYGTRSENARDTLHHGTNHWANQAHCKNGHEFTPENVYTAPGTRNRQCRICHAATMERFLQRQAALKAAALK